MPDLVSGRVSVVIVNFRGADDVLDALGGLEALRGAEHDVEIVVVDNGSGDGSVERLREVAGIELVESERNLGFAGGCNLGVGRSTGEFVAFLNSDAKPEAGWIDAAIRAFASSPRVGAVASRVLDWEGTKVDYVDAAITWFGMGYKPFEGLAARGLSEHPKDVLFATGSAMFVRRDAFDEAGGFDERFFMFFEDVDLGWRLNLLGWTVRYEPSSVVLHRHHAAAGKFGSEREIYHLERNALFALYKNLDEFNLSRLLPPAIGLAVTRSLTRGAVQTDVFDYRAPATDGDTIAIDKVAAAGVFGVDRFVRELAALSADRRRIQSTRRVSDTAIWPLFGRTDAPGGDAPDYLDAYEATMAAFPTAAGPGRNVLIITGDPIGPRMAGPAIRAWNMALALSRENVVTLLTTSKLEPVDAPFELALVRGGDDRRFARYEEAADVIVFQGHAMAMFRGLAESQKVIVVDIYDPMHLEQLEQARELPPATWAKQVEDATGVLNEQMLRGDFFLCASERQRYLFLGQLAALGRVNPATYQGDPDLERLLAVVPFGLPDEAPMHRRDALRGVVPGIDASSRILLWGGGLYNWFDPETLIRAVSIVSTSHDEVRLFFQGTKHPHPDVPEMEIVSRSRELARELGVLDRSVFFNESWVPYDERQNYLLEADAGVSTHFSHVETTFSFRTRILDYLWAGLPIVVTEGDSFADLVEREGLGVVVPAEDPTALAAAIERVLFDADFAARCAANIARVRESFGWSNTLEPLVRFVREPRRAADLAANGGVAQVNRLRPARRRGFRRDVELIGHYLANGGPRVVLDKVRNRIRKR